LEEVEPAQLRRCRRLANSALLRTNGLGTIVRIYSWQFTEFQGWLFFLARIEAKDTHISLPVGWILPFFGFRWYGVPI
jgi:hypothetical protein